MSSQTYETVPQTEPDESTEGEDDHLSYPASIERRVTVQFAVGSPIGSQIEWKVDTLRVYEASDLTDGEQTCGYYLIGTSTVPSEDGWAVDGHRSYIPDDVGEEGWYIDEDMFENHREELEPFLVDYEVDNDE